MDIIKQQLRSNIVSLYDGYASSIAELAAAFSISEREVIGYIKEEEALARKRRRGDE